MSDFAQTLKSWRNVRRYSQLDLATEAEISSRHLSFLETGRARPSREMVQRLGEALQLPLEARNQMLTHAGFAARYAGRQWSDDQMEPIRGAVQRMLDRHMPFPGMALDRMWVIRHLNPTAETLFGMLGVGIGDSMIELVTSDALPPLVENWPEVARHAAARLRVESAGQGGVPEFDRAVTTLLQAAGPDTGTPAPVIPTILRKGDMRLSMFATIAQFGTPEDLTLEDLKIELYFPMDAATEAMFGALGGGA